MKPQIYFSVSIVTICALFACVKPPANIRFAVKPKSAEVIPGATGKTPGSLNNVTCSENDSSIGLRSWRRLSNAEIIATTQEVFKTSSSLDASSLTQDQSKLGIYDTVQISETFMNDARFQGYNSFAESVAANVNLSALFPCMAEGAACVSKSIATIGDLAWRRPLTAAEKTNFVNLYTNLTKDGVLPPAAFGYLVQAMILSPYYMYRSELGEKNSKGEYELTSWEIASSLSYLIWRRPPDAELRALAAANQLTTPAAIAAQAEKMFADSKAKDAMAEFGGMWLDAKSIKDLDKALPELTSDVRGKLSSEIKNFFVDTMFDANGGTFAKLLTSDSTLGDASTAFVYQSTAGADGKIPYTQTQRRGILGQAGYLASTADQVDPNTTKRGHFISKRLLCVEFGTAPAVTKSPTSATETNRDHSEMHAKIPGCANCHNMLDPFGYALENFDANGMYRTMDRGFPVNAVAQIILDKNTVTISSPEELSKAIAASDQGLECFARQSFRYTLGRIEFAEPNIVGDAPTFVNTPQAQLDQCQINKIKDEMKGNGGKLKSAIISLVSSPAFRLRLIGDLEVKQPISNKLFEGVH